MLGLGNYGSGSDSDSSSSPKPEARTDPRPLVIGGGGAVLAVKKKPTISKSSSLLSSYHDSDDSDEDDALQYSHAFGGGAIDIISSPTGARSHAGGASRAGHAPLMVLERPVSKYRKMNLLPLEPPGKPDPALEEKVKKFLRNPQNFNASLMSMKTFHNPYILNKIVDQYRIDNTATNYPEDMYDPEVWKGDNLRYTRISRENFIHQEAIAKRKAARAAVGSEPGGQPPAKVARKTKWDRPDPNANKALSSAVNTANTLALQRQKANAVASRVAMEIGVGTSTIDSIGASINAKQVAAQQVAAKREAAARLAVINSQKR